MENDFDLIIVGAGAAGLMCALQCPINAARILLLDAKPKVGAKILMSGGTRCNVTNRSIKKTDFNSEKINLAGRVLAAYPSAKTIDFFKELGVELIEEPGGKLFPTTHSGRTVLEALLREVTKRGIRLQSASKVTDIQRSSEGFMITGEGFQYQSRAVVLSSGGLSYPATGSDGTGYAIAQRLGHGFISTCPSLTPLVSPDGTWRALSGLSLPCRLSLRVNGRKEVSFEGPLLFTHFGFSGPLVLNISRHWIRSQGKERKVIANFIYAEGEEAFRARLDRAKEESPKSRIKNFLAGMFPERFSETLLAQAGIPETRIFSELRREERETLVSRLSHTVLLVSDCVGYKKAEVTAGGVPLDEVDTATMESRKVAGLFFAGEILDVDGRIGGFNFQWAWASGYVAGHGAAARIQKIGI